MKILFADDDRDLVELTTYALLRHGHRVIACFDGEQALQRWQTEQPDLVLLDAVMPALSGFQVCERIRHSSPVPIIIISGCRDEADLVRGYECGADDYLLKPFSVRHLFLRIEALMRRMPNARPEETAGGRVSVGDLAIDRAAFEMRKNGRRITLTRLEFRILYFLAQHAGSMVPVQRLAEYAWQSPSGGDGGLLKTHVSHIRQKLTSAGGDPIQIRAIPRTGYILSAGAHSNGTVNAFAGAAHG